MCERECECECACVCGGFIVYGGFGTVRSPSRACMAVVMRTKGSLQADDDGSE